MNKSLMMLAVGAMLTLALTGCSSEGRNGMTATAQAAEIYSASALVADHEVTLTILPAQIGENEFVVTVDDPTVTAVEAQVIMASMGHGVVVDLTPTDDGRFKAASEAINMGGRWMVRTRLTHADGQTEATTFHMEIGTSCLPATTPSGL